jgi:hypothetical protein
MRRVFPSILSLSTVVDICSGSALVCVCGGGLRARISAESELVPRYCTLVIRFTGDPFY